jgi:membrane dipeptidase
MRIFIISSSLTVLVLLAIEIVLVRRLIPPMIEQFHNKVSLPPPYQVRKDTEELHKRIFIADLHADPLMWDRDLLKRYDYGHFDIPRALDGNVALQVFGVSTKNPKKQNFYRNSSNTDQATALVMVQAWPPRTWGSLLQRALYQADKLKKLVLRSQGRLMPIRSVHDLDELLVRRKAGSQVIGVFPALEGVHALEGELANLDLLYDAGFRMIGLAHFFDNEAAGSAHGMVKGGLTPFGRELIQHIQAKHLVIDLAHSSPQTIDDVLSMATSPVVLSHTGVRGTCDNPRNLSDDQARQIAATGGVVGIAMFVEAVCGITINDTAKAIRYVSDLVGVDYVAVGSDFDGGTLTPFDVSGMALLTEALIDQGSTEEEIAKIMGGNVLRVLRQVLPKT